jgi:predicted dehydrogenase
MSRTASIPVAIVGCGIIGANHSDAILRHPRLRVAAVVDPDPAARRRLATRVAGANGGPPAEFPTLTAALAGGRIGLVAICTPTGTHGDLAAEALAAGAHVVVEKPLEATLPRARLLAAAAAAAAARSQVCSVISQHRFDPASVVVAEAVAAGHFGRVTSAVASVAWWRGQEYYDSADWRGTWALDGGGATMNQGIHTVDLLLWLLGEPVEVFAHTGRLAHDRIEVEDVAVATVRLASGALAVLHATTAAYPGLAVRLQVHGTRGSAVIHDDQLEYFHAADGVDAALPPGDRRGASKPADSFVVGHLRQYEDVVAATDEGRPPAVGVDAALCALATVHAVYLSASLGRPVAVPDVLDGRYDDQPIRTQVCP